MEKIEQSFCRHYLRTDAEGRIVEGWSDGPHRERVPGGEDILLSARGGYQFRLILDDTESAENPPLYGRDGAALYRWDGERVLARTGEALARDRAAAEAAAEEAERRRAADDPLTLLLEMAADHEERICLMEMGVSEDDL